MNKEFKVLGLVFDLGYTIAVPLVVFALGGRFLDKKLETAPLFLLIGIFAALAASGYGIYKKIKQVEESDNDKAQISNVKSNPKSK